MIKGNDNNNPTSSSSNDSNTHDVEHSYNQRHNSTEFETFYRQLTESAMNDDGKKKFFIQKKKFLIKFYFSSWYIN
jgi:hypothetical protein